MATKYQEYYKRMVEVNKNLFDQFSKVHTKYQIDTNLQDEFNRVGKKVMEVIKQWEQKLCRQSEVGGYGSYTTSLAEKFMGEIRNHFPLIDRVGIIITKKEAHPKVAPFLLKKIKI